MGLMITTISLRVLCAENKLRISSALVHLALSTILRPVCITEERLSDLAKVRPPTKLQRQCWDAGMLADKCLLKGTQHNGRKADSGPPAWAQSQLCVSWGHC